MPLPRATARVAPTESYKECGAKWNPPVTASPCQSPLGKGAEGTGDADCHSQFANWPRNDKVFCKRCDGRAVEDAGPYGGFPDRISQGLPHPFSPHFLFSVCGFPVDKLPLPISPPFLWKFIISPVDKKSMHFAALRGFSTKVFSTTIITKKYLVYVLWAENMPGNFGIRKESVPC